MDHQEKNVRIFISSTFKDMHSERDHLVKYIFPELKKRGLEHGLHIQEIDLRWGVTEAEVEAGKALEICLDEIEASRPFFIGFIGSRYGWIPDAYETSGHEKYDWLMKTLPGYSITALEVLHGVLNQTPGKTKAFFFFREPTFIDAVPEAYHPMLTETDDTVKQKITALKTDIVTRSDDIDITTYTCDFKGIYLNIQQVSSVLKTRLSAIEYRDVCALLDENNLLNQAAYATLNANQKAAVQALGQVYVSNLDAFAETLLTKLWDAIVAIHGVKATTDDALDNEQKIHRIFALDRTHGFIGRPQDYQPVLDYLDTPKTAALCLFGSSGSGKSTVMAKLYLDAEPRHRVLALFCGLTEATQTIKGVIDYWNTHLAKVLDSPVDLDSTTSYKHSIERFHALLWQLPEETPWLFMLDGLDQLLAIDEPHFLQFIPKSLPPHVKLIVSTTPGAAVEQAQRMGLQVIELPKLDKTASAQILTEGLKPYRKALTAAQQEKILQKQEAVYPLYLKVAQEILRTFPRFEELDALIDALPETTEGLFSFVIEQLRIDYPTDLVDTALGLIETAHQGIIESEIIDILNSKRKTPLPMLHWSRFYRSIAAYLTNLGMEKDGHIRPFHTQFAKAIRTKVLSETAAKVHYNQLLASYALNHIDFKQPFLTHTIQHVGYYLYRAEDDETLRKLFIQIATTKHLAIAYRSIFFTLFDRVMIARQGQTEPRLLSLIEAALRDKNSCDHFTTLLLVWLRSCAYLDSQYRLSKLLVSVLKNSDETQEKRIARHHAMQLYVSGLFFQNRLEETLEQAKQATQYAVSLFEETKQATYYHDIMHTLYVQAQCYEQAGNKEAAKQLYEQTARFGQRFAEHIPYFSDIAVTFFSAATRYCQLLDRMGQSHQALSFLTEIIQNMKDYLDKDTHKSRTHAISQTLTRALRVHSTLLEKSGQPFDQIASYQEMYQRALNASNDVPSDMMARYQVCFSAHRLLTALLEANKIHEMTPLLDRFLLDVKPLIDFDPHNPLYQDMHMLYHSHLAAYFRETNQDQHAFETYIKAYNLGVQYLQSGPSSKDVVHAHLNVFFTLIEHYYYQREHYHHVVENQASYLDTVDYAQNKVGELMYVTIEVHAQTLMVFIKSHLNLGDLDACYTVLKLYHEVIEALYEHDEFGQDTENVYLEAMTDLFETLFKAEAYELCYEAFLHYLDMVERTELADFKTVQIAQVLGVFIDEPTFFSALSKSQCVLFGIRLTEKAFYFISARHKTMLLTLTRQLLACIVNSHATMEVNDVDYIPYLSAHIIRLQIHMSGSTDETAKKQLQLSTTMFSNFTADHYIGQLAKVYVLEGCYHLLQCSLTANELSTVHDMAKPLMEDSTMGLRGQSLARDISRILAKHA